MHFANRSPPPHARANPAPPSNSSVLKQGDASLYRLDVRSLHAPQPVMVRIGSTTTDAVSHFVPTLRGPSASSTAGPNRRQQSSAGAPSSAARRSISAPRDRSSGVCLSPALETPPPHPRPSVQFSSSLYVEELHSAKSALTRQIGSTSAVRDRLSSSPPPRAAAVHAAKSPFRLSTSSSAEDWPRLGAAGQRKGISLSPTREAAQQKRVAAAATHHDGELVQRLAALEAQLNSLSHGDTARSARSAARTKHDRQDTRQTTNINDADTSNRYLEAKAQFPVASGTIDVDEHMSLVSAAAEAEAKLDLSNTSPDDVAATEEMLRSQFSDHAAAAYVAWQQQERAVRQALQPTHIFTAEEAAWRRISRAFQEEMTAALAAQDQFEFNRRAAALKRRVKEFSSFSTDETTIREKIVASEQFWRAEAHTQMTLSVTALLEAMEMNQIRRLTHQQLAQDVILAEETDERENNQLEEIRARGVIFRLEEHAAQWRVVFARSQHLVTMEEKYGRRHVMEFELGEAAHLELQAAHLSDQQKRLQLNSSNLATGRVTSQLLQSSAPETTIPTGSLVVDAGGGRERLTSDSQPRDEVVSPRRRESSFASPTASSARRAAGRGAIPRTKTTSSSPLREVSQQEMHPGDIAGSQRRTHTSQHNPPKSDAVDSARRVLYNNRQSAADNGLQRDEVENEYPPSPPRQRRSSRTSSPQLHNLDSSLQPPEVTVIESVPALNDTLTATAEKRWSNPGAAGSRMDEVGLEASADDEEADVVLPTRPPINRSQRDVHDDVTETALANTDDNFQVSNPRPRRKVDLGALSRPTASSSSKLRQPHVTSAAYAHVGDAPGHHHRSGTNGNQHRVAARLEVPHAGSTSRNTSAPRSSAPRSSSASSFRNPTSSSQRKQVYASNTLMMPLLPPSAAGNGYPPVPGGGGSPLPPGDGRSKSATSLGSTAIDGDGNNKARRSYVDTFYRQSEELKKEISARAFGTSGRSSSPIRDISPPKSAHRPAEDGDDDLDEQDLIFLPAGNERKPMETKKKHHKKNGGEVLRSADPNSNNSSSSLLIGASSRSQAWRHHTPPLTPNSSGVVSPVQIVLNRGSPPPASRWGQYVVDNVYASSSASRRKTKSSPRR